MKKFGFSFLAVGKAKETTEGGYKLYQGIAGSHILAINPDKKTLDELMGFESQNEPEYKGEDDQGKYVDVVFIVKPDPETNSGIDMAPVRASIRMRPQKAYNKDKSKVQVIDNYGNFTWAETAVAEAGNKVEHANKLDRYRIACVGECALIDFLHKYLNLPDAFAYKDGTWTKKPEDKAAEGILYLERLKELFSGDVSEIRELVALQPNNKIKLLYGIRTNDEGKRYQAVCTREQLTLNNAAGANSYIRLEKDLANAKANGSFQKVEFKVQELKEWDIQPTNFNTQSSSSEAIAEPASASDMPWED